MSHCNAFKKVGYRQTNTCQSTFKTTDATSGDNIIRETVPDIYAPEATEFDEVTQNKGHYAVQGHSRSPILTNQKRTTTSY